MCISMCKCVCGMCMCVNMYCDVWVLMCVNVYLCMWCVLVYVFICFSVYLCEGVCISLRISVFVPLCVSFSEWVMCECMWCINLHLCVVCVGVVGMLCMIESV